MSGMCLSFEPRALGMLGKLHTTKLHLQPPTFKCLSSFLTVSIVKETRSSSRPVSNKIIIVNSFSFFVEMICQPGKSLIERIILTIYCRVNIGSKNLILIVYICILQCFRKK